MHWICLTYKNDIMRCQWQKLSHHIIPQRYVENAEGAQADSHAILQGESPHKLLVNICACLVRYGVLPLKWDCDV